jgi:hypothetical protein
LKTIPNKQKYALPTKEKDDEKNRIIRRNPSNINQYIFLGYCYSCKNFGHKAIHCKAYRKYNPRNVQRYENNKDNAERRNYNSFSPLQDYNVECYKCNNYGHKASECRLSKYDKRINIPNNKKVWKKKKTECNVALYARNQGCQWYIDSGCSKHMTGDQRKFLKLKKKGKGKVTFGDNMSAKILGKGTVSLGNNKTKAEDVLLVENLKPNILSVSQTCDQGHILTFDSQKCEIRKKDTGKLVAVAPRTSSNVYILNIDEGEKCCLSQEDESWLWHRRLGHLIFDNLIKANKKEAVRDLPKVIKPSDSICKHCQIGKQTRVRFKTKEHSTTKPLELIHTDLCGPTRTKSTYGEHYFMLIIDDYTRLTWVYFLKEKSEAFEKFKTYKALVENETDLKIKCLRSDNGGEFTSKEFHSIL